MDISICVEDTPVRALRVPVEAAPDRRLLAEFPLLAGLGKPTLDILAAEATFESYRRGATIFRRGSTPTGLFLVLEGAVKLVAPAPHGKEKTIELFEPGRMFGEIGVFRLSHYRAWTQAVRTTRLIHIPALRVLEAVRTDHTMALRMLSAVSGRVQDLIESISQTSPLGARSRVCAFLLEQLGDVSGSVDQVVLAAPKSTIASILNMTSEAFSRVLRSLREDRIIDVHGRRIRIHDRTRLAESAGT